MRSPPHDRLGITLVEVLISIFVLGLGLLSVLSLFTAGRDLEARAVRQAAAVAYVDTIEPQIVNNWSRVGLWRWTNVGGSEAASWQRLGATLGDPNLANFVQLPVVIDPYGLNADTVLPGALNLGNEPWWWHRFVLAPPPVNPAFAGALPFRRTALMAPPGSPNPVIAQSPILNFLADPDAIEFSSPEDQLAPPRNKFAFGRRARGTELTPAIFVAQYPETSPTSSLPISPGLEVIRWLLVFRNLPAQGPSPLMDKAEDGSEWPAGFLKFEVDEAAGELLTISVRQKLLREDPTSLRRSLKPRSWILIARKPQLAAPPPPPEAAWMVHWARIVTADERNDPYQEKSPEPQLRDPWTISIDPPLPNQAFDREQSDSPGPPDWDYLAFTFESLIHVKQLDITPHVLQE
jgi:hypothetical protein